MVESDRKKQRHHKEQYKHARVRNPDYQQEEEAEQQNHQLRNDDVCENRPDKKPVFTLEERQTVWAVMPDAKQLGEDLRLPTRRTKQSYTPLQYRLDLLEISFHDVGQIVTPQESKREAQSQNGTKRQNEYKTGFPGGNQLYILAARLDRPCRFR